MSIVGKAYTISFTAEEMVILRAALNSFTLDRFLKATDTTNQSNRKAFEAVETKAERLRYKLYKAMQEES